MIFRDQLDRSVEIVSTPKRVVSLVPSQTELLVDLGLEDSLVGVTKFCIHPRGLKKRKTIVGGTKNYRMEVIDKLQPDLIIGNKEENDKEGIEELAKKYPVWLSDIYTLEDNSRMINALGRIFNCEEKAKSLSEDISTQFSTVKPKGFAVYLIWNSPMLSAGQDTFINQMLGLAGFDNMVKESRYPELTEENLIGLNPDFLLLSSEPFPFKDKHLQFFRSLLPQTEVMLVDGELFSWYGSRLLKSKSYFDSLLK